MSPVPDRRTPVAVLGATGAVGQNFIRLLAGHPWFQLAEVAASERSAGRTYGEATKWIGSSEIPDVNRIVACLQQNTPQLSSGCRAVFQSNNQMQPQQPVPRNRAAPPPRSNNVPPPPQQVQPRPYDDDD